MQNFTELETNIKSIIDDLKGLCSTNGLSNTASEEIIVTSVFLYKFLNDKFIANLHKFAKDIDISYDELMENKDEYMDAFYDTYPQDVALAYEDTIDYLVNFVSDDDFYKKFDEALVRISSYPQNDAFNIDTAEGTKSYKSSGGEMIWNEELKREIPKDWSINTVKNYCNITWGQCPDGINILPLSYNDENTFLYCSGAGDMRNGIVVDCQAKTNASKRLAHKNDILMSIAGSIGALCICDKTISLGRAAVAFTQKENQSLLTYQLINVFATRMKSVSSGSIQKVINDNHLNDIKFAFSKEIFELYTSKFNSILEVIINFEHKNKELVHLKEKMLPLLINGQLI